MELCDCDRGPATVAVQLVNKEDGASELVDSVELCRECAAEQGDALYQIGLNEKLLP